MAHDISPLDNMRSIGQALESCNEPERSSSGNLPGVGKVDVKATGTDELKDIISQTLARRPVRRLRASSAMRLNIEDQERYEYVIRAFPEIEQLGLLNDEERQALVRQQRVVEENFPLSPRTLSKESKAITEIWALFKDSIENRRVSGSKGSLPPILPPGCSNERRKQLKLYLSHVHYPYLPMSDALPDWGSSEYSCKKIFEAMGYFVFSWEPPEEHMARDDRDASLREALGAGKFDNEAGATLLFFNSLGIHGKEVEECLIWTEEGREQGHVFHVGGKPSILLCHPSDIRVHFLLDRKGWWNISHLFIAPSSVARMLYALDPEMDSGGEAQLDIAKYAKENGISPATDMDFDEVSNLIYTRYPEAVIAIYDPSRLNAEPFVDEVLAEAVTPFVLARKAGPGIPLCNRVEGVCFNLPPQILPEGVLDTSLYEMDEPCDETPEGYLQTVSDLGQILLISFDPLYVPEDFCNRPISDAEKSDINISMSTLRFAGVPIDPEAEQDVSDFVSGMRSIYGCVPLMTNFVHAHYLDEGLVELPDGEKINATVELKRRNQPLFEPGKDVPPCIIQYSSNESLCNAVVYDWNGQVEFTDSRGRSHPISELEQIAKDEWWYREGPVSILKLSGNGLRSPEIDSDEE